MQAEIIRDIMRKADRHNKRILKSAKRMKKHKFGAGIDMKHQNYIVKEETVAKDIYGGQLV